MNLRLVTNDSKECSETVLELACAAQRFNGDYIKTTQTNDILQPNGQYESNTVFANAALILKYLGYYSRYHNLCIDNIPQISIEPVDVELASDIKKFYKYLAFEVMSSDSSNGFKTKINEFLLLDYIPLSQLGFIACLPQVYNRESAEKQIKKSIKTLDEEYIGKIGETIYNNNCNILSVTKSKNFDANNVNGIINNKLVAWTTKHELLPGPCFILSAKIKAHNNHWKFGTKQTQMNYVIVKK